MLGSCKGHASTWPLLHHCSHVPTPPLQLLSIKTSFAPYTAELGIGKYATQEPISTCACPSQGTGVFSFIKMSRNKKDGDDDQSGPSGKGKPGAQGGTCDACEVKRPVAPKPTRPEYRK